MTIKNKRAMRNREFDLETTIKTLNAMYLGLRGEEVKQPPIRDIMKAVRYAVYYLNKDYKLIKHGKITKAKKAVKKRAKAVDYKVGDVVVVTADYGKSERGVVSSIRDVGDGSLDVYYAPFSRVTGEVCKVKRKKVNNFKVKVEK